MGVHVVGACCCYLQVDQALSMEEFVVGIQKLFRCCLCKRFKRTKPYRKIYPNKEASWFKRLGFTLWEGEHYDDLEVILRVLSPPGVRWCIEERLACTKHKKECYTLHGCWWMPKKYISRVACLNYLGAQ